MCCSIKRRIVRFDVVFCMRGRASGPVDCTEISGRGLLTKCRKKAYQKKFVNPLKTQGLPVTLPNPDVVSSVRCSLCGSLDRFSLTRR